MLVILKKFKIFLLLFLILIFVVAIKFFVTQNQKNQTVSTIVPPTIQAVAEAPTTLQYSFEKSWPSFPLTLPIYKISQLSTFSLADAKKISNSFGFNSEPQTARDIEAGAFYNWNENNKSLSIGGQPTTISFGFSSAAALASQSSTLSQKTALDLAKKTLVEKGLSNPLLDLNHPVFTLTDQVVGVSFQFLLSGVPLLNNNPSSPAISLFFDGAGNLIKLDYIKYPPAFEKTENVSLLSQKQALANLTSQKGIVVYFADKNDQTMDVPVNYQVSLANITGVSLAYYYPRGSTDVVVPVFVFEGEGLDQEGKTIKITTFLPATQ